VHAFPVPQNASVLPLYPRGSSVPVPANPTLSGSFSPGSGSAISDKWPEWVSSKRLENQGATPEERNVFETTLTGIELGKPLEVGGRNNLGIYPIIGKYKDHDGESLLLKALPISDWSEVKALHIIGDLIDSGKLKIGDKEVPVIVMKKHPGKLLAQTDEYRRASSDERKKMREHLMELTCDEVARLATTKYLFHEDNNLNNVLVTFKDKSIDSVNVIDWSPYTLS